MVTMETIVKLISVLAHNIDQCEKLHFLAKLGAATIFVRPVQHKWVNLSRKMVIMATMVTSMNAFRSKTDQCEKSHFMAKLCAVITV